MKYGRSLAMNSANSVTTNRTRKIHSDTCPRRLALKFCQRRRLSGDMASGRSSGGTASPPGATAVISGFSVAMRASISRLARREIDAWIDKRVGQIGDQSDHKADERKDIEVRENDRVVAIEHALEAQEPKSIERENRLNQEG